VEIGGPNCKLQIDNRKLSEERMPVRIMLLCRTSSGKLNAIDRVAVVRLGRNGFKRWSERC
jgi:hypothetical protein